MVVSSVRGSWGGREHRGPHKEGFFVGAFGDLPSLCHKKWICLYLKEEMVLSQTKEEEEAVSSGFG